jgi:chromosome segregation ATPase
VEQQLEILWKNDSPLTPLEAASPISQDLKDEPVVQVNNGEDPFALNSSYSFPKNSGYEDPKESGHNVTALLDQVSQLPQAEPGSEPQRIQHLEQALYQCQLYIDELKQRLVDQEFLEEQLAATESFSHVQKQAIETLKSQVAQQQPLRDELEALRQQMIAVQTQFVQSEAIAKDRETEFSTLKLQMLRTQSDLDRAQDKSAQLAAQLEALQSTMVQETQQRIIAQKTAERLRSEQRNRAASAQAVEAKLERADTILAQREEMIVALQSGNRPYSEKDQCIQGLSSTLLKAQRQITDLENELSNQSILQAQLQHTTHELEHDAKNTQSRSDQLENQVNDLQEQVLRQAQQASEYETAVQHWKTRSLESEEWASQVAKLWDNLDAENFATTPSSDLTQALTDLSRWFKGARRNLAQDEGPSSPQELLGSRPRWQKNLY